MGVRVEAHDRIGNPYLFQHQDSVVSRSSCIARPVGADGVGELATDRDQRIQRRLGVLDNESDLAATNPLQGAIRLTEKIPAAIHDGP